MALGNPVLRKTEAIDLQLRLALECVLFKVSSTRHDLESSFKLISPAARQAHYLPPCSSKGAFTLNCRKSLTVRCSILPGIPIPLYFSAGQKQSHK